jgi:D-amino-acid dehydrogenase
MNIQDISFDEENPVFVTDNNSYTFDKVVIACGAFSKN